MSIGHKLEPTPLAFALWSLPGMLAGLFFIRLQHDSGPEAAVLFGGVAFGLSYIPLAVLARASPVIIAVTGAVAIVFPMWGLQVAVGGAVLLPDAALGAALAPSLLWGAVLVATFRAWWILPLVVLAGGASGLASPDLSSDPGAEPLVGVWHILVAPSMGVAACVSRRRVFLRETGRTRPNRCESCGYSLTGLPVDATRCPECGVVRPSPRSEQAT